MDVGLGEDGKRKQARRRGFKTKKDAQAELDRLRTSVAQQTYVALKRQTVAEYLDEWLAAIEHTVRPSTFSSYKRNVRVHVEPAIGPVQLQRLDAAHLNRMYGALRGQLSVRTVRYIHTIVHRALRDAVKWGRVVRNVADVADPPRAEDTPRPEMLTWSAAELAKFLAAVQGSRHRNAWVVLATSGMRRGECLGLRWRDVDLDAGRLSIRQQVIAVDNRIVVSPCTKSGKARAVDLDAPTLAELRAHKARRRKSCCRSGFGKAATRSCSRSRTAAPTTRITSAASSSAPSRVVASWRCPRSACTTCVTRGRPWHSALAYRPRSSASGSGTARQGSPRTSTRT